MWRGARSVFVHFSKTFLKCVSGHSKYPKDPKCPFTVHYAVNGESTKFLIISFKITSVGAKALVLLVIIHNNN